MIYLKDGNIPLNLAYDDDIVQEANSTYQLSFKFPLTDGKWHLLKREVFLLADDLHGEQEFFIFEVKKAKSHVQVYAKQVATLLNYYSVNTISVDRVPGQTVMTALAGSVKRPCPFTFFSDILDRHTFNESNISVMDALVKEKHSILGQWGGDLVRDKYQVKLLKNGGIENESLFMYKKNLSSYEESENINNLKTRLHLKTTIQGQSEGEADRVIAVTVDSPLISQYSQIYEADIEVNDQDVTDEASLLAYGQRYFSSTLCDLVENSINLDVKSKTDVAVKMFDTVSVFHERFDVDLRLKITSYHFAPMSKRLKSIGFGKVSQSFGSTVANMVAGSVDKVTGRLSASFEQKLQKEIDNANRHFDAEFDKRVEEINDGIEQSKAEAEAYADNIKQSINTEIDAVNQSMQAQSEEHDRQVADILFKTQSVESLANQAKSDAASAITQALLSKDEAVADARAQVATVSQALNTAKSELQSAIASADQKARDSQASATALRNDLNLQASKILEQARAQTDLTNRVTTVETLADGTRSTVAELSKTVNKATGDIASVTSRTKTVEDTLSQTRTQYEALTQTINAQTGQIDSINRKTADLQSGIDGVINRFETIWVSEKNLLSDTETLSTYAPLAYPANNYLGRAIKRITKSANTSAFSEGLVMQTNETLVNPKEMILSFYVKANRDARIRCFMYNPNANKDVATSDGYTAKSSADGMAVLNVTTSWQRVWIKWTYLVNYFAKPWIIIGRILETYDTDVSIDISAPALYHGHHNKEWSPADLDFKNELATYVQNAQESSADLARRIETADGKAVDAKAYAQQTANGFNTRIESLESYKNAEGTRAEQYLSASRTETAKQLTAERTAIANNYVAKSAYDENVRGTTLKLNEIKTTADTAKQNLATYQNTVDRKLTELTTSTQTLDGKINTASAKVDTVAGQIRTEISEVEGKIPTKIGATNYIRDFGFANGYVFNNVRSIWRFERIEDGTARSGYHIKATCTQSGTNGFHRVLRDLRGAEWQGRTMTYSVDVKASKSVRMLLGAEAFNKGYKAFDVTTDWKRIISTDTVNYKTYYSFPFYLDSGQWQVGDVLYIRDPQLEDGTVATTPAVAPEDLANEISSVKTTITQTASGVEQLSTSLSTTNNKVTTAEAKISQLISDVSSKVSQKEYNTLTGRMSSAETLITQNATEISKRLTSTQVESVITGKGYQTKSQVDSNITGRGYITNSALQPYALSTTVQNLVKETADSFSRTISRVESSIPTDYDNQNLWIQSKATGRFVTETLPDNHITGQRICYKLFNNTDITFNIEPDFSDRLYRTVTFSAWVKYENVVQGPNSWNAFNCFKHTLVRKNSSTGSVTSTDYLTLAGFTGTSDWKYISYTYDYSANTSYDQLKTSIRFNLEGVGSGYAWVTGVKVELGSKATRYNLAVEELATVTALHDVKDTVSSHTRTIGAVGTAGSILDNVSKVTQTASGLVQEVSGTNGLKTQVSTLAGSYAIKSLTKAGDVLGQINLNKDGSVKLDGSLVQITGKTYIQDGVITSAKIAGLDAGKITTGTLDAARIAVNSIDGSKMVFDQAFVNKMTANEAYLKQLFAKNAFITSVQAVAISASNVTTGILRATNGAMDVNLDNASMIFRQDAKIEFQSENNTLFRTRNGTSAFIHFRDDSYNGVYTAMGVNADNTGTQNDYSSGLFAGVRVIRTNPNRYSGTAVDQVQIVADEVRFRDAYGYDRDYLTIIWDKGSKIDLVQWMRQFNTNFKHLVNITGRGDVIKTF
ncbi:hypothetical protein HO923_00675 [Streptococcus suis]|nr:hypothetical protein [Streptococcus suis]